MKNKICGECKYYTEDMGCFVCGLDGEVQCIDDEGCGYFVPANKPTNGDVIRQGGNEALVKYRQKFICHVCAYRFNKKCNDAKCKDGLIAWLNTPAESEVNNG